MLVVVVHRMFKIGARLGDECLSNGVSVGYTVKVDTGEESCLFGVWIICKMMLMFLDFSSGELSHCSFKSI